MAANDPSQMIGFEGDQEEETLEEASCGSDGARATPRFFQRHQHALAFSRSYCFAIDLGG
jgi:hypothetical protein